MTRITGSEALVEALRLEGIDTVFGINGSAIVDPLDLFDAAGISFVQVRNEQNAGAMADGYTQASGKMSACIGQNGPGVTNLVSGVAMAYANHTPMLVITPAVTTTQSGSHIVQEVDQIALYSGITVFQHRVATASRIPWAIRTAFREATAKRGPAQVDIPRDLFYELFDYREVTPDRYRSSTRTVPEDAAVAEAARMLHAARKPLILCGLGVSQDGDFERVGALADRFDAIVATVYNHNDAFDNHHPRYVGPIGYCGSKYAMQEVSEADVVLALGTRLNPTGTAPQYDVDFWPHDADLILNDRDASVIGAHHPVTLGLPGDCALTVEKLLAAAETADGTALPAAATAGTTPTVAERVSAGRAEWNAALAAQVQAETEPLSSRTAIATIAEMLPADAIVTADAGNATSFVTTFCEFSRGRSLMMPGTFGSMGGAFANAIGAKIAVPERPVIAITGDGAWSTGLQEVLTCVAEEAPVISVVLNNHSLAAERANQLGYLGGRFFAADLENPDFADVAALMGADSYKASSVEELASAFTAALEGRRTAVIDVQVDVHVLAPPRRKDALQSVTRNLPRYQRPASR